MKATELRRGNIISDSVFEIEVTGISEEIIEGKTLDRVNETYSFNIENLQGIPLTEEWLLKFGFTLTISNKDSGYKQYGMKHRGFDIMFCLECDGKPECYLENIGIDILFVHQLHNLYFALTGTELQITK